MRTLATLLVLAALAHPVLADTVIRTKRVTSDPYHIDKKYRSMVGPWSTKPVYLLDSEKRELLWIVGYRTTVVDADDQKPMSQEFMCHANLDFEPKRYYKVFPQSPAVSGRLFTLSQGQQEVRFPHGFGIPVVSDQPLDLTTQVLNLNLEKPQLTVQHEVEIDFVRDADLERPMQPLFQAAVEGFKVVDGSGYYGMVEADPEEHGPGCSVGLPAIDGDFDVDGHGQKFAAHWVVKPGREVNKTLVTRFLALPFDTTVHYIAVHLHPFAESLELIDRTTGKTVFRSGVIPADGRIGIERVDYLSSQKGIPLYKDHEYELVSVYNNTSGVEQDSMAVMYLYLLDKQFEKPK